MNNKYFGIGIIGAKKEVNIGGLFRSAHAFGASFIFTIGRRYSVQSSDTTNAGKNIPLLNYKSFDDFYEHIPNNCRLIGIEQTQTSIILNKDYQHPDRCVYLLGAEDYGLCKKIQDKCFQILEIPGCQSCLNVSSAGSIILYDRILKDLK
jgi:tRNA G18 (ribose-2'-O)-methylase SpoU